MCVCVCVSVCVCVCVCSYVHVETINKVNKYINNFTAKLSHITNVYFQNDFLIC